MHTLILHTYKYMFSNIVVTSFILKLFTGMQDMTKKVKSDIFSYYIIFILATGQHIRKYDSVRPYYDILKGNLSFLVSSSNVLLIRTLHLRVSKQLCSQGKSQLQNKAKYVQPLSEVNQKFNYIPCHFESCPNQQLQYVSNQADFQQEPHIKERFFIFIFTYNNDLEPYIRFVVSREKLC